MKATCFCTETNCDRKQTKLGFKRKQRAMNNKAARSHLQPCGFIVLLPHDGNSFRSVLPNILLCLITLLLRHL